MSSPFAELHAHIRRVRAQAAEPLQPGEVADEEELRSVRRFRRMWNGVEALERLAHATARQPANAGPLNSHVLVLRSLALMRELSPQYLRRFLVQIEALQWIERAAERMPKEPAKGAAAKAPRKGRRKAG